MKILDPRGMLVGPVCVGTVPAAPQVEAVIKLEAISVRLRDIKLVSVKVYTSGCPHSKRLPIPVSSETRVLHCKC